MMEGKTRQDRRFTPILAVGFFLLPFLLNRIELNQSLSVNRVLPTFLIDSLWAD